MCGRWLWQEKRHADLQVVGAKLSEWPPSTENVQETISICWTIKWSKIDTVMQKAQREEANRALPSHFPIFAYFAATDAGPDQVAAGDMIAIGRHSVYLQRELSRARRRISLPRAIGR